MFYNFVILRGLLLFVFGVDNEVAFCRLSHSSLFYFRQINVLIISIGKISASSEVSECSQGKAQLDGLVLAHATLYFSSFNLLVLFT